MTLHHRAALMPLATLLGLSLIFASPTRAQQAVPPAVSTAQTRTTPTPATPAPAPAPHQSALYAHDDVGAPTIAAAEKEHADAMRSRNHTIVVSTTVIVLCAIILVLLIA